MVVSDDAIDETPDPPTKLLASKSGRLSVLHDRDDAPDQPSILVNLGELSRPSSLVPAQNALTISAHLNILADGLFKTLRP